ncbi:MAG TPA: RNA-binding domain-containing protein [Nitrosopumilaceae archaeon]|nr:RNA-binding domain-containing protein [Nitrosopumilaceae archaeon]
MKTPNVACKIEAYAAVNPSEDPEKVRLAVSHVLLDANFKYEDGSIKATSKDLQSLAKIYDIIRSRGVIRAYRRQMRFHTHDTTTWFYLNKQAAFVDVIAICEEAEESPMGPIKIIMHSEEIQKVIDWLVPESIEQ